MRKLTKFVFFASLFFTPLVSFAKEKEYRPVALVNGKIISNYDVEMRAKMIARDADIASKLEEGNVSQVAFSELLLDFLKVQAAEEIGIKVDEENIAAAISNLEKANKLPAGGFYDYWKSIGITKEAFDFKVRADIAWNGLVFSSSAVRRNVKVSDAEVEAYIEDVKAGKFTPYEFRLKQLFLNKDMLSSYDKKVLLRIKDCKKMDKEVEKIGEIIDIGRVKEQDLTPPVVAAIKSAIEENQTVTQPISNENGMFVMIICSYSKQTQKSPAEVDETEVRKILFNKELTEKANDYLQELRRRAVIEIKDPHFSPG